MRVLGIDPGLDGGAALRVDGKVVAAWTWTRVADGVRLRTLDGEQITVADLHAVGEALAAAGPFDVVVCEGLYVPAKWARRAKGADVLKCAVSKGEVLGPLRRVAGTVEEPLAVDWRREVLGLPKKLSAGRCEAYAIAEARREGWLPRWTQKEQGAVAEAGAMARWRAS